MTNYDLLGLFDTYRALKADGVQVPNTFNEFLAGVRVLPSAGLVARVDGTDRTV